MCTKTEKEENSYRISKAVAVLILVVAVAVL